MHYIWTPHEANGGYLDGGKHYRLHLPPGPPVRIFWSVAAYDCDTRSMLCDGKSYHGLTAYTSVPNADGSVDVYFGPRPPNGSTKNWVRTVAGKGWYPHFRFYSPLEPCREYTWTPDDIVEVSH